MWSNKKRDRAFLEKKAFQRRVRERAALKGESTNSRFDDCGAPSKGS
jgi:hypothetical protein